MAENNKDVGLQKPEQSLPNALEGKAHNAMISEYSSSTVSAVRESSTQTSALVLPNLELHGAEKAGRFESHESTREIFAKT